MIVSISISMLPCQFDLPVFKTITSSRHYFREIHIFLLLNLCQFCLISSCQDRFATEIWGNKAESLTLSLNMLNRDQSYKSTGDSPSSCSDCMFTSTMNVTSPTWSGEWEIGHVFTTQLKSYRESHPDTGWDESMWPCYQSKSLSQPWAIWQWMNMS